ncbi:MAG: hemolysin III family protein [Xanthomonadales bacterium]|nr:hemolysin III family protein [Xanthomonadales bacterium]
MTPTSARYSPREELANGLIHGVGILLSIIGLALLVGFASARGSALDIVAGSVFGATLIMVYTTSTLYHAVSLPGVKQVLRKLDHIAIFLLIAGTYTPFTLAAIGGRLGWSLFALIWSLAVLGIVFELTFLRRWTWLAVGLYLGMGWIGMIAIKPLAAALDSGGLALVLAGGAAYTLGVIFYLWRRLPYSHAIWHVFVLVGSLLHFLAVLFYIVLA